MTFRSNNDPGKPDNAKAHDAMPLNHSWSASLLALAIECALTVFLVTEIMPALPALLLHMALISWLTVRACRFHNLKQDLRIPLLLLTTTAVMGPFGPAGVILTQGLKPWYDRSARAFEKWYASLFPEEAVKFDVRLYRQIQAGEYHHDEESTLMPFIDILSFGSRKQKQAAIALITNNFQPSFAPALRMALNISDSAIRVQAATAIAKIENRFFERVVELDRKAREQPESPEMVLALARHYDDYAFAGILDEKRERENRELAVEHFRAYLKLNSKDLVARAELGRVLVRKGDFAEAAIALRQSIDQGDFSPQISLWYMESLYQLRRLSDLREFVEKCSDSVPSRDLPVEVGQMFRLWSNSAKGHHIFESGGVQ